MSTIQFPHVKENSQGVLTPLPTRLNLECLMTHIKIKVNFDVIRYRPLISGVKSMKGEEENSLIAHLKSECGFYGLNKSIVDEQLTAIMQDAQINPVVDCIKNLKRTKKIDPIHELVEFLPFKNKAWVKIAMRRWLIQCIAAADKNEHSGNNQALPKYESVLTFFGSQGLLKTAFIRALIPKELNNYIKDGILLDLNRTDSKVEALSSWLTELGELDSTFKKSDISALKAFLSRQEDEIRRPYAKAASIMPRSTSFFASVNEERFLRDSTGNRRYLPITVTGKLDLKDFDILDLWAHVWQLYCEGEQWWLTDSEEEIQKTALEAHEDNSIEELLFDEFIFEESWRGVALTGNQILDELKMNRSRANSMNLSQCLKKQGIEKKTDRKYLMPKIRFFAT